MFVDNAIDEESLVRNNQDKVFNNYNLTKKNIITFINQAVNGNKVITKAHVDQFHKENERSRQNLCIEFYIESCDLVKKIKIMISTIIN